jgi:hypothetical protein
VRRDTWGANVGLLALGTLLVAGVALVKTSGVEGRMLGNSPAAVLLVSSALLGLAIGGLMILGAGSGSDGLRAFTGIAGRLLAGAGIFLLVVFALCVGVASTCPGFR